MAVIHYELIGTHPEVEHLRDGLGVMLVAFRAGTPLDHSVIEMAAEHFYGLRLEDFDDVHQLADAVQSLDQEVEFA